MHDVFEYDSLTGIIYWRNGQRFAGKPAGNLNKKTGYVHIRYQGKCIYAHRLAWFLVHGIWPIYIDHDNGIKHDNKLSNLKDVLKKQNHKNMRRFSTNTSSVTGVHKHIQTGKWIASITVDRKNNHLGCFDDFDAAVTARRDAEKLHGFNPNHGRYA